MIIKIDNPSESIPNLMRRLGYAFQKHEADEMAFVRPFGASGFPRFHVYAHMSSRAIILNIHLDQHKETYGSRKGADAHATSKPLMHHGEYENDGALAEEVRRIKSLTEKSNKPIPDFEP